MPYSRLTSDCISSWRLTRVPASSNAFVVIVSRPCPNSPISRSRRSRRSRSMKISIPTTTAAVPSGPTIGPSHAKRGTCGGLGGDHDGSRPASTRLRRLSADVGLDDFDRFLQLLDRAAFPRSSHVFDFRQDVDAVQGKILGEMVHLPRESPAGETEDREDQRDHRENGRDAADPAFQPADRWSQHEREQYRERDRHEHVLRPVQDRNDEHAACECDPRFQRSRQVIHGVRPLDSSRKTRAATFRIAQPQAARRMRG